MLAPAGHGSAHGQALLTVVDAVARATTQNPDARMTDIAGHEAATRVAQARAGLFPRVDVTDMWQRGNQPVFVFGSLLGQQRFTEAHFAIPSLNRPDAIDNFRVAVAAEHLVYDGGAARSRIRAARLGVMQADTDVVAVRQALTLTVTSAYGAVLQTVAAGATAQAALDAADADLARATARRDAGLATDADALAVEVHRARVAEMRLRASLAEDLARAELNRVMGEPLDAHFTLELPPVSSAPPTADAGALETEAVAGRPELRRAALDVDVSGSRLAEARAAYRPQVFAQAGWEGNGGAWHDRAGSWGVGAGVRLNVFRGGADRARVAEAEHAVQRVRVAREQIETAVRLDVRAAVARVETAYARQTLAASVVAQAQERQRIVRDRYEQGLADVTTLLQAAEAVMQAHEQQTRARVDVLIERASLDKAVGR